MKAAIVVLCAFVVVISARPEDKYTDRYDNTDYKEVVKNDRLFGVYRDCLLDLTKKCPPEAKELKSKIKDALETHCANCTDKQKEAVNYVIKYLIDEKPDDWKLICDKYDPTGKFKAEYEKELKAL